MHRGAKEESSVALDMKPLVSILIPAHNAEKWIGDTLRSAVGQTWEPKEIIVIDDGSIDRTLDIARGFESAGVRVVKQDHQGAAAARNVALSLSRGDYIQWLDADDLLAVDKIAAQMEEAKQCQSKFTLISCAWGRFLHRYQRATFIPTALWCNLSPVEWLLRNMEQNLYMQTATWLVSRELTDAAGPWDTRLLSDDDKEYFCRVLLRCDGVRFVRKAKTYYRSTGPGSLSYIGRSNRKLAALWCSMQLHVNYLRSLEDSERTREVCFQYLQNSLALFYPERSDITKQIEGLTGELGRKLEPPRLSWKYSWIVPIFGWGIAKRLQIVLTRIRWWFERVLDKFLCRFQSQTPF